MRVIMMFLWMIGCVVGVWGADESFKDAVSGYFSSRFSNSEPGGAVLIAKSGRVIFEEGYGLADLATREKITPDTLFNTGSISKTFVATGILVLQQQGRLSIEDRLAKYFPDFKKPQLAQAIKIVHFLSHTSGIVDSRKVDQNPVFFLTADDRENFAPLKQNDGSLFNPGEKFDYSNPAYNGLALIIEAVSGMKWQNFIRKHVFEPAGMQRSTITDGEHPRSGVSHGYVRDGDVFVESDYGEVPTFCAAGNGGVWSSVRELMMYEGALRAGKVIDKVLFTRSRTVYKPENWQMADAPQLGYGWFVHADAEPAFVGHTGSQGGFISDYVYFPEWDVFYVVLCNTPKPIREYRQKVCELILQYKL